MPDRHRIGDWQAMAEQALGAPIAIPRRTPIGQLVKSAISSRTRDAVSLDALHRLKARFGRAAGIAHALPPAVEREIAAVTFVDVKAVRLVAALRAIEAEHGDFRLDHLGAMPLGEALAELERLPGIGRKTAASVLNFSTLRRPVLVVDTHVARVLNRLGLPGDPARISETVTAAVSDWDADRFLVFQTELKRLRQTVCRRDRPDCARCPLAPACATVSAD